MSVQNSAVAIRSLTFACVALLPGWKRGRPGGWPGAAHERDGVQSEDRAMVAAAIFLASAAVVAAALDGSETFVCIDGPGAAGGPPPPPPTGPPPVGLDFSESPVPFCQTVRVARSYTC